MNPIRVFHHQETRGSSDPDDLAADTAAMWAELPPDVQQEILDFMDELIADSEE